MAAGLGLRDKLPVEGSPAAEEEADRVPGVRPGVYREALGWIGAVCGILFVRNGLDYGKYLSG